MTVLGPTESSSAGGHGGYRAPDAGPCHLPIVSSYRLFSRGEAKDQSAHGQVGNESDQTMPEEMRTYRQDGTYLVINRAEEESGEIHSRSGHQCEASCLLLSRV